MSKACARHPDRESVTLCRHCQKPVCKACLLVTPQGHVCSSECSLTLRLEAEQKREQVGKKGGRFGKTVTVIAAIIVAACLAAVLFGAVFSHKIKELFLRYGGE